MGLDKRAWEKGKGGGMDNGKKENISMGWGRKAKREQVYS